MKSLAAALDHIDSARAEIDEAYRSDGRLVRDLAAADEALALAARRLNRLVGDPHARPSLHVVPSSEQATQIMARRANGGS